MIATGKVLEFLIFTFSYAAVIIQNVNMTTNGKCNCRLNPDICWFKDMI